MDSKAWFKSKIILIAAFTAALGAVEATLPSVRDQLPPETFGWMTLALAVIIAVLRVFSATQAITGVDAVKALDVKSIARAVVGKE